MPLYKKNFSHAIYFKIMLKKFFLSTQEVSAFLSIFWMIIFVVLEDEYGCANKMK